MVFCNTKLFEIDQSVQNPSEGFTHRKTQTHKQADMPTFIFDTKLIELKLFVHRWYLMSSVLPLMRVSSELPLRDPVHLENGRSREAVKRYLDLRYSLLAYFYSLFHDASNTGVPVARPMFFDFPIDKETWTKYEQFMIGPALLARPAFHEKAVSVPVYFPAENTSWYHFEGGHEVNSGVDGVTISVTSLTNELVLLLRGGFIVPTQVRYVYSSSLSIALCITSSEFTELKL
jgi:alpha 1,3-glucosidase